MSTAKDPIYILQLLSTSLIILLFAIMITNILLATQWVNEEMSDVRAFINHSILGLSFPFTVSQRCNFGQVKWFFPLFSVSFSYHEVDLQLKSY